MSEMYTRMLRDHGPMIGVYTTTAAVVVFFTTVLSLPIPESIHLPSRPADERAIDVVASRDHFGPFAKHH